MLYKGARPWWRTHPSLPQQRSQAPRLQDHYHPRQYEPQIFQLQASRGTFDVWQVNGGHPLYTIFFPHPSFFLRYLICYQIIIEIPYNRRRDVRQRADGVEQHSILVKQHIICNAFGRTFNCKYLPNEHRYPSKMGLITISNVGVQFSKKVMMMMILRKTIIV